MLIARPPSASPPRRELRLVRAARQAFTGPAAYLADPGNRALVSEYLTDLTAGLAGPAAAGRPAALLAEPPPAGLGQSYAEMAEALIGATVLAQEPVDLLILAFSVHDLRPGQQAAGYLSYRTPGEPMAFAVCDQGPAAAFTGLRIASAYASSAGIRRALLIVVEQAALPYDCAAPLPARHQGVAMLWEAGAATGTRVAGVRQHPGVLPGDAAAIAAADLAELAAGRRDAGLVAGSALAASWTSPAAGRVRVAPAGQPSTGVWWGLIDELAGDAGLVVAADYDPDLRYLCLAAFTR